MKSKQWYIDRARKLYDKEGQLEVDPTARVSFGDDPGAYVEAWIWIPDNEPNEDDKDATDSAGS
jgi:hypothetical protein